MSLSGKWTYRKENQRTLAFNVAIQDLPIQKTVFSGSSSNYSAYGFEMHLSRSLGPFILSIYLPSAMFVTMSWVSFFVPPDIVPARIVLLVTLCLVLINMFNSTTARIPVSNAVTAMEVWLLACMTLVFLSLVEYAVILRRIVLHQRVIENIRKENEKAKEEPRHQGETNVGILLQLEEINNCGSCKKNEENGSQQLEPCKQTQTRPISGAECVSICEKKKRKRRTGWQQSQGMAEANLNLFKMNLDRGATYLFPCLFGLFNICYWVHYLVIMPSYFHTANRGDE